MSTLTIFLCAASFFTAQTIASSQNLVIGQIDQAIEKINASAMRVFLRAAELGSQDADKLHELFVRPCYNIEWSHISTVNSIVGHYANSNSGRNLSEDKKKECMSYYDAYETEFIDIVQGTMDSSPWNAIYYAEIALGDLLHMASENKIELENLKLRVNVGNTTEWNNIKENVKNISTRFVAAADKAQKFWEGLPDGTSIIKVLKFQTNWDENFNKGSHAIRKVYECVQPKSSMGERAVRLYHALFPYLNTFK